MNRRFLSFCGAALLLVASSAHAVFVTHDSAFGADTLILNETTGQHWLRMDVTRGLSYNDVAGQLSSTFSGFRIAHSGEVADLFSGLGIPNQNQTDVPTSATLANARLSLLQLGAQDDGTSVSLRGFPNAGGPAVFDPETGGWHNAFLHAAGASVSADDASYFLDGALFHKADRYSNFGTYLVTAPVPEPETYALMLAGLLATVAFSKRRRRA